MLSIYFGKINAAPLSLMLTPKEIKLIQDSKPGKQLKNEDEFIHHALEEEISKDIEEKEEIKTLQSILYLGGIIYINPTSWTVWLNDDVYDELGQDVQGYKIKKVSDKDIILQKEEEIFLKPHHSLNLKTKKTYFGDLRLQK